MAAKRASTKGVSRNLAPPKAKSRAKSAAALRLTRAKNRLGGLQSDAVALDILRLTIADRNLLPFLESLGAELPTDQSLPRETRLLRWAAADVIDKLSNARINHTIPKAFEVIAQALDQFAADLFKRSKASRKRLTAVPTKEIDDLRHAAKGFRTLHSKYPSFSAVLYLSPLQLRSIDLRRRGGFTDVIEENTPDGQSRQRLCRLDKNGNDVRVLWHDLGFSLDDSDFIEETLADPNDINYDISPTTLGILKRALVKLTNYLKKHPDNETEPAWPGTVGSAQESLSEVIAALEPVVVAANTNAMLNQTVSEFLRGASGQREPAPAGGRQAGGKVPEPADDGPFGIRSFRWGKIEKPGLAPKPIKLLRFLWNAKDQTASFSDLETNVWEDKELNFRDDDDHEKLSSAKREVNRFFQKHAFPFKVSVDRENAVVSLIHADAQPVPSTKNNSNKKPARSPLTARR